MKSYTPVHTCIPAKAGRGVSPSVVQRSAAALTAAVLAVSLQAQPTPAPAADETVKMDQFVVRGYRSSLIQSLNDKRNANAIIDVITAEDVGKFPDTNVAESLSHVPGITVDRLFGQGEKVSILGTDPALNRTLLNGQTVASGDWFILDNPGRTFNYTLLAPEIVGKVEVHRTPQAWLDEGSIGGTVIVHTRNPLTSPSNKLGASVGYMYNERSEEGDPNFSAAYSWHNADKTFGFAVSTQHSKEHIRRDGLETYGTVPATEYSVYANPTLLANPTARGPNAAGTAYFNQDRERTSYTGTLTFRPNRTFDLQFDALYVKAAYDNINQSLYTFPARPWDLVQNPDQVTITNGVITRMHLTNPIGVYDVQYREAEVDTKAYTLRGGLHFDKWNINAAAGFTEASGGTQRQLFGEFLNRSGYAYDISGSPDRPLVITWDDPTVPRNPAVWETDPGWGGNLVSKPTEDTEDYAQIDVDYSLDAGAFRKIRGGLKVRMHETDQDMYGWSLTGVTWAASRYNAGLTPSNFLSGIDGITDQMRRRLTINGKAMAADIASRNLPLMPPWRFFDNIWSVSEDVTAGYLQADFGVDKLNGNVGFRYVNTETESNGYIANTSGVYSPRTFTKSYDNILPTANVSYEIAKDVILRASAAQVIARPNYADMTPYLALNDTVRTGDGGNPQLDPYESLNLDFSAEWYLAKDSIVAATIFYKDIDNYILRTSAPEQHFNVTTSTANVTYQVSRPRNAGSASSQGFALNYQQSFSHGLGAAVNYTYVDASADNGADLPFASKNQINLSPFWEHGKFLVRVTYSWRSKYFTGIDRGDNMYTDDYTDVSAAFSYRLNDMVSFNLDGMNLLDETYFMYANTERLPRGVYKSGARYVASVRFSF